MLPKEKFYQKYYADALSHQFSISNHLESREWFANIGANLALVNVGFFEQQIQVSTAVTIFNTIIKTPGHIQVYTVDYLVDFFGDVKLTKDLTGRFIFGHLSAHYSDDGIVELGFFPISYVRDYAGLHGQYILKKLNGKIYAGGIYIFHNEPRRDKHTTFQIGGDAGYFLHKQIKAYFAFDIKIKSEVNNGTTQSFQAGIVYPTDNRMQIRLAYTHRRGFEERGQIYNFADIKNTIGIYLDF